VGFKAKELLHMSISDDPRGFRRGQPNNTQNPSADGGRGDPRQSARPDPRGNGARQGFQPRQDEDFGSFPEGAGERNFAERPAAAQRQPSFSAFRPEAYADPAEKQNGRADHQDWRQANQFAGDPRSADRRPAARPQPQPEPFRPQPGADRGRTAHDPYADVSNDPYDTGRRDFGNDWNTDNFQAQQPAQFPASNYYSQHDEPNPSEVQSVHNRFFSAEPEPAPAPPPPAPPAPRYRQDDFAAHDYAPEPPARAAAHHAPSAAADSGFDDGNGYRWDNFDQPPAPESVRPFPNAKLGGGHQEDELDADYFADEDEFEGEDDYIEPKKGGKKLMAAVLMGAVVTGGGLAYLYKAQVNGGAGSEPPIMTADARPIKEQPSDPGGREFPNGSKLIYDRLDSAGATGGLGGEEPTRVASREESDAENGVPGVVTTGASGSLEERIQNALQNAKKQDDTSEPATSSASASYDEPQRVRTQIFRPDGSVDGSRAQRRQAPAEEASLASGGPAPAPRNAAREAPAAAAPAARSVGTQQIAAVAPATPANIASGGNESGMFVQIAARNDQAAAMAAFADLQQKYAGVLGNHSPSVRKVDLGEKGVWYRLLVGPMGSKGDADKLCEELKAAGMKGCFSRKE
jgi:hypothetical protein